MALPSHATTLPAPRAPGSYRVAIVCSGNICRSPVADVVLNDKLAEAGLASTVTADSFGTGGWHVGEAMDQRSAASLVSAGYDGSRHRARQYGAAQVAAYDLVLAMDAGHFRDLGALGVPTDRLRLFRDFDPEAVGGSDGDVPDPFYGGPEGFVEVLEIVERTAEALVDAVRDLPLEAPAS
jgi:protein-tyrosine phosphatase